MPVAEHEQKGHDGRVVWFRKKSIEDWNRTLLPTIVSSDVHWTKDLKAEPTYKRSTKLQAASFFNSETLMENFWIVLLPKVSIFQ